jgi:hypothetical protein
MLEDLPVDDRVWVRHVLAPIPELVEVDPDDLGRMGVVRRSLDLDEVRADVGRAAEPPLLLVLLALLALRARSGDPVPTAHGRAAVLVLDGPLIGSGGDDVRLGVGVGHGLAIFT